MLVRFVTSTLRQDIEPSNERDDSPAQIDDAINGLAVLGMEVLQLKQLCLGHQRRERIVYRVL
jgi:hypothetical protein